jgi:hypothetical protein
MLSLCYNVPGKLGSFSLLFIIVGIPMWQKSAIFASFSTRIKINLKQQEFDQNGR